MDSGKVMTSDTDLGSDMDTSENLGHGFGLGQLSDTRVRPTLIWMLVKKFETQNGVFYCLTIDI